MHTRILLPSQIEIAADLLRQGECVAFPTETVYGLGANALDEKAVAKIFLAKGRPADNPLIIHCHSRAQLGDLVVGWPRQAEILMDAFWPGPLTLVLYKKPCIPSIVTGGLATVALRFPDHPVAISLLKAADLPIAAPSANVSGKPSPTRAEHVMEDMLGKIAAIIDGGPTGGGVESTVLDCTVSPFRILRPGGITLEQIRALVPVELDSGENADSPRSPGMKYRHYSPDAQVVLVTGGKIEEEIQVQINHFQARGMKVAVMAFNESPKYSGAYLLDMGSKTDVSVAAARIYHLLRQADSLGVDLILIEGLPDADLGRTIMNRLRKAAGKVVQT
ncbi:MAG: L-threonylcarbamoyladenylate synthase [Eubacteriales bacterium]|nr:L-threonylcarbamoyladenylate synthase [Eubacteriales bacterium]MDD4768904.1 L-threonylcarbamoyladenylate synthase [Eubacteriales bacterium]